MPNNEGKRRQPPPGEVGGEKTCKSHPVNSVELAQRRVGSYFYGPIMYAVRIVRILHAFRFKTKKNYNVTVG